jgi:hypothetical protein
MKTKEIIIKSADSDATLRFSNIEGDWFSVCFKSQVASATRRVWGYTDCEFLVDMFVYMADSWKGWTEELSWLTLEGDFEISATSDKLGHVKLCISINNEDTYEPFALKAYINIEAGQLDEIAKKMKAFFGYENKE